MTSCSRSLTARLAAAILAGTVLAGTMAGSCRAQSAGSSAPLLRGTEGGVKAVARPAKKALPRKAKPVLDKAAAARPAEKPRLAPWAAIDPGRAGEQENVAPNDAPMPGVHHEVPAAEGNTTLGVKFSTNNDPNYGPATTSGLINSYNNVTTGSPDPGTSVQPGVKFKF